MTDATHPKAKARVFVLYTGGTIGMAPKDPSNPESPLEPKPLNELLKFMPGLDKLGIEFGYGAFDKALDSSSVGPSHWLEMAERLAAVYDEYDGFVVLHGTDTMAYTSSALSFIFENLGKPVVITGSQLPISDPRTDAKSNLVNALHIAGYKATGLPCVPEVIIVFADKILRGCRARKVSSSDWAGFDSPNCPALGTIGEHIRIDTKNIRPMPTPGQVLQVNRDLADRVLDLTLTPGFKPSHLKSIVSLPNVDAVVLRTFGAGNAMEDPNFLGVIEDVIRAGKKTILNVTQCVRGMVEMGLYDSSSGLLERGVISGLDMTPEAAYTKLMWTLGTKMGEQIVGQMQVSQRGEQSENLFDLRYGGCGNSSEPQERFADFKTPDGRFAAAQLSRAVVRISGLGVTGIPEGKTGYLRIFMNLPSAKSDTPASHARCVAEISLDSGAKPMNFIRRIADEKAVSVLAPGDVTLSVVADPGIKFWFDGLFLALFAKA